ncbi:MAG: alpha/beta hydrolase-fold protein [Verrucomicrobiota bacterium]|nr:alpha/beta hydrolase-fold protein [Verrucomicrobiota bacterium]
MATRALLFFLLFASTGFARSPHKESVTFSYTGDVGFGNSVFVAGNHPDVGNWDVTHAVKLRYTSGNVWTAQVAIQAGSELQYRFIARSTANGSWCNSSNVSWLTPDLFRTIPAQPEAPYRGKTIYYLSGWSTTNLFYNSNGTFVSAAMAKVGAGRAVGESLFKITGIGEAGESLEFVFTDGNGHYDNPPGGGNYLTALDVFEVQDGNVFSYQPRPVVSAPQIVTHFVDSSAPNIPGRTVRVYLPRGYTQNTARRYPVLYLHDGQNVFDPGGPFGSWSADASATREIGQGRMREAILVGIDNTSARIPEYMPPTDTYQGVQGRGDAYASFVVNNVRPYVDFTYRTLNDPKNTVIAGSSLGGLISLYFGREFSTFGKIGVLSPAYWIAPNYISQVVNGAKKPLRVYEDFGTAEPADDWDNALEMYDVHLAQGYAANADVTFVAGCGQAHNEAAWKDRFPGMLHYLLPAQEEPNGLAATEFLPRVEISALNVSGQSVRLLYHSIFGLAYTLERSVDLRSWTPVSTSATEDLPWSVRTIDDNNFGSSTKVFWRLKATPMP